MTSKFLLLLVFFLPMASFAKADFSPDLLAVVDKYRAAKLVTMDVDKKIKSELMDKETEYLGTISLSGEKFLLETSTPEKAQILFDGSVILNVQYPPKELGGTVQALRSKVSKKNRSQILLSTLLDRKALKNNFKVVKESKSKSTSQVTIEPLNDDLTVKSIDLTLNTAAKILTKISYKDDVGNLTTMEFSEIKFLKKVPKDLFKIKLPKDAQVTDL